MKSEFEIAAGSVAGRDHKRAGRNNQDAYRILVTGNAIVALVCDGCGSGEHSEVGANIGASLIVQSIRNILHLDDVPLRYDESCSFLERVRQDVLAQIRVLALSMGNSLSKTIEDYFLFTAIGFIIAEPGVCVFSIGDGLFALNGEVIHLGPFPNNEPPYMTYGITGSSLTDTNPEMMKFIVHRFIQKENVRSILIGTDGAGDFANAWGKNIPGKDEQVNSLDQFWNNDAFYKNPFAIGRRLYLINQEAKKIDWASQQIKTEVGLLPDDTTIVVARRKQENLWSKLTSRL